MVAMVTVFILEKHIRHKFFEYVYKVKLEKFQLPSFRRSAVTNENSLGGGGVSSAPPPGKVGFKDAQFDLLAWLLLSLPFTITSRNLV